MTHRVLAGMLTLVAGVALVTSASSAEAPTKAGPTEDIVRFSQGGMMGQTKVEWDPQLSSVKYESWSRSGTEKWSRQPSSEEWRRFWTAMDAAGVWSWKGDYGTARHTDCVYWSLALKHGSKGISSTGCSVGPDDRSFEIVVAALTRLRGDASVGSLQGLDLAKQLQSSDWNKRMETVRALGEMGSGAGAAASALVELLDAAPIATGSGPGAARDRGRFVAANAQQRDRGRNPPPPPPDTNETARKQAALADAAESALAEIGEPAVPALVQALEDRNPNRRRRAAKALREIGPNAWSAFDALTLALKDPALQQAAASALVRIDPRNVDKYVPLLIKGLDDRDRDVARLSAKALSEIPTDAALRGLIHALDDERTHDVAMTGIYRMGPRAASAIPFILPALRDEREEERQVAASTLGAMGPAGIKAVPALINAVRNDTNGGVRENAARALGAIGPGASQAVPALVDNLRYGDRGYKVATGAATALAQIGAPSLPALIAALKCDHLEPATPPAPTGYQGRVYPETENVRVYAAYALSGFSPPARAAIPALTESLRDSSPRVREAAALALKGIQRQ